MKYWYKQKNNDVESELGLETEWHDLPLLIVLVVLLALILFALIYFNVDLQEITKWFRNR